MPSDHIQSSLLALEKKSRLFSERLNGISDDIKKVESALQALNIGIQATVKIGASALTLEEREVMRERHIPGWQFINAYAAEELLWARDPQSGKFRITYLRILTEDRVATGGGDAPDGTFSSNAFGCARFPDGLSERRPLIECQADVRLRAWPFLPELINAIEKEIDQFSRGPAEGALR